LLQLTQNCKPHHLKKLESFEKNSFNKQYFNCQQFDFFNSGKIYFSEVMGDK
jgi:hypothetical protein